MRHRFKSLSPLLDNQNSEARAKKMGYKPCAQKMTVLLRSPPLLEKRLWGRLWLWCSGFPFFFCEKASLIKVTYMIEIKRIKVY